MWNVNYESIEPYPGLVEQVKSFYEFLKDVDVKPYEDSLEVLSDSLTDWMWQNCRTKEQRSKFIASVGLDDCVKLLLASGTWDKILSGRFFVVFLWEYIIQLGVIVWKK